MDRPTLLTLLNYQFRLLSEQIDNKRKYLKLELEYSKDRSLKRKQFLAQSVQAQMKLAMAQAHKEIKALKEQLKSLPPTDKKD
jgi:uncharacterized protein YsxB (DUF464 family)